MADVPLSALLPFLSILAAIAVCPIIVPRFWDSNRNKLLLVLVAGTPAVLYLLSAGMVTELYHTLVFDYVPFMVLLGALFVITGGIFVDCSLIGTPAVNTTFLALGAVLSSLLGTTGAAMLLIRPLFHINRRRSRRQHTVLFFIAIACNCGGLLTPLGDPPLFMMYLRGAPFAWFFTLFPEWLLANGALLVLYYVIDRRCWAVEPDKDRLLDPGGPLSIVIQGRMNLIWLAGVMVAIAFLNPTAIPAFGTNRWLPFSREAVILLMAVLSLKLTPHITRVSNGFTWKPIEEVACLFFGIFVTVVPCLIYLGQNAASLGVSSPRAFYYASGLLSSFLDNTPTAMTFHSLALGLQQSGPLMVAGIPDTLMRAICTASVFFGAMTYIGNGPNFMVRTMAEHQGIPMPHFFEYIWKFSLFALLPIFVLVQLLFIR